jgi:hypothetical protein
VELAEQVFLVLFTLLVVQEETLQVHNSAQVQAVELQQLELYTGWLSADLVLPMAVLFLPLLLLLIQVVVVVSQHKALLLIIRKRVQGRLEFGQAVVAVEQENRLE